MSQPILLDWPQLISHSIPEKGVRAYITVYFIDYIIAHVTDHAHFLTLDVDQATFHVTADIATQSSKYVRQHGKP